MSKLWLIARREYWINVRRPGFLFSTFAMPIILGIIMVVVANISLQSEEDTGRDRLRRSGRGAGGRHRRADRLLRPER
jgi:ABC-type Na+ efflux pump permease subunit